MLYWQVVAMKNFDIIKEIRSRLNLSQTEFAGKLGVSFATVNLGKKGAVSLRKLRWTQSSVCVRTAALITHSLRATVFFIWRNGYVVSRLKIGNRGGNHAFQPGSLRFTAGMQRWPPMRYADRLYRGRQNACGCSNGNRQTERALKTVRIKNDRKDDMCRYRQKYAKNMFAR